jgi:hypothetical protein
VNSLNLSGYIFDPWSKEDAARFVRNLELNVLGDITIRDAAGYIGEYFSKTDVIELAQLYKTPAEKYFGDGVRINEQDERRFNEVYKYSIKLKEVLDLPNNRVFIRDKLKAGGTLNEMIDNLESIIKSGSPFLEIVDKEPKTLGYLMCLSEDVLRKTSDLLTSERSFRDFVIKNPKQIANIVRNLQGAENLESFQHRNDLSEKSGFLKRVIEEGGNSRKKAKTDEGQSRG